MGSCTTQWAPRAQGFPRPKGPQGPRVPKAQGSPRPRVPKARPSPDKVLFFLGLSWAHGASWRPIGNHEGLMVASLLNNGATIKLPWGPRGCKRHLWPPPRGHQKKYFDGLGGSGSQVWPNRAILWGSKAACPGMLLAPFWTDFGLPKPRL